MKDDQKLGLLIQKARKDRGLTQEQLALKSGVPYTTLTKIESGAIKNPSAQVVSKLARALSMFADAFLSPQTFRGPGSVEAIWSDALSSMESPGDFMCISGVSESQYMHESRGAVEKFVADLKARGFSQKLLTCEGDRSRLKGDNLEYRWIPKKHFNPTPIYVYADTIAMLVWGPPQQSILIKNQTLADSYRKQFLFLWEHASRPFPDRKTKRGVKR